MHIRKLVKAGASSHTVSLPKNWIQKNQLDKGSIVYVVEETDNSLRIKTDLSKQKVEKKETTIITDKKDTDSIHREITSAYLNNYSKIVISGKDLGKKADSIRNKFNDFVALEIVEQTSKHIVAKDMLNLNEVSIDKTIRRIDMILRSMLMDVSSTDKTTKTTIGHRDYDVNRLYFLLFRILKQSLTDDVVAAGLDLERTDILSKWYLTLNLQNLANGGKKLHGLTGKLDKENFSIFKEVFQTMNQNYLDVMKAYFTNDKGLANQVAQNRSNTEEEFHKIIESSPEKTNVEIVETLKSMSTRITNISRIIIDQE